MTKTRKGITLVEMIVVFVVAGVLMAIGLPRFNDMIDRSRVSAARDQVLSALDLARRTAVRRATTATFNASGDSIWVTVDSSGTAVYAMQKMSLTSVDGVTLTTSGNVAQIVYNMRGLSSNAAGMIYLTRNDKVDSVCVSILGAAMRQGCP